MKPSQQSPAVGRLAPSPTGGLHLGHARTFLIAWLAARSGGGRVILRIEDLDAARVRDEARDAALVDLRWLGLDWDEGPYVQSDRRVVYDDALDRLKAAERIYPCTCTRADIERAASAPHPEDEGPTYPGACAHRLAADARVLGDRPFAWRFRVKPGPVAWDDQFLGRRELDPARLGGDFVIARNTLGPSYQLAVVVDDALMGVSQVVRGADLVPSTPRQILLYQALGWTLPRFGHVPLVVGPDGRRLAKRDGSIKLSTLREQGVDPQRLIGALARSCGWTSTLTPSYPADWINRYDPDSLPGDPWFMNPAEWLVDPS
ncbi:MAG: tRNA glutamyl-Q(34) synthetase GluQRS [Paludisphaera borealis]|uniref:tRNA glutamyl-Q(34) synthetase GluQRS n=1 Tax=Paludisphaera borealis TaxID=1387353 RepID=UPI002847D1EB|nr:tRNA glutamyl-Q(34) synthetase GluQRS [Paludisphaera borealis]MDR3617909.1 tRNA glutamyl-Q(34) synthetase GluQRS [Paludisphaera borealis]